jgi:hypothetical protein
LYQAAWPPSRWLNSTHDFVPPALTPICNALTKEIKEH